MTDQMKIGVNLSVTSLVVLYVSGFLWQYAYLGSITDHVGWIKIVTVDYIYLGVMALVFTIPSWFWAASAIFFAFYYSGVAAFLANKIWMKISFEKREKIWLFFNDYQFVKVDLNVSFMKLVFFFYLLVAVVKLPTLIIDRAQTALAYRLSSGGVDILCEKDSECHKGKVLYANDKQFYFYTFDGSVNYDKGQLLVVGINDVKLKLDWYVPGKRKIDQIVSENIVD